GADAHALAAPRAPGLVGVAVGADDDLGVLTPLAHVQDSHDLNVLAGAHAARAQHAGAHVVANHRVAWALVAVAQRQVTPSGRRRHDTVAHDVPLELVAGSGAAAVDDEAGHAVKINRRAARGNLKWLPQSAVCARRNASGPALGRPWRVQSICSGKWRCVWSSASPSSVNQQYAQILAGRSICRPARRMMPMGSSSRTRGRLVMRTVASCRTVRCKSNITAIGALLQRSVVQRV